jgi:uncharacterized protein with GYD domain
MPKFVVLVNFTQNRVENIKDLPAGLQKAREIMESQGAQFDQIVYTMGKYDAVVICDAPNAEAMSKALLSYASLGLGRTEFLKGFTPEEMVEMVNSLP